MKIMRVSGPMFEPSNGAFFNSVHGKDGAHYNCFAVEDQNGMKALRQTFPEGIADGRNFCLFSTSGIHGMYTSIEEVESWVLHGDSLHDDDEGCDAVTFLIVQPRICCLRYGNCLPKDQKDFDFLKRLRASSWDAATSIGRHRE